MPVSFSDFSKGLPSQGRNADYHPTTKIDKENTLVHRLDHPRTSHTFTTFLPTNSHMCADIADFRGAVKSQISVANLDHANLQQTSSMLLVASD